MFTEQRNLTKTLIRKAKSTYFHTQIEENKHNPKTLFSLIDKVLHKKNQSVLPDHTSCQELAETFLKYFSDKVTKLRATLDDSQIAGSQQVTDVRTSFVFDHFTEVSEEEIQKIISKSPSKSCTLDPVPTTILKQFQSSLLPLITKIVNASLREARFPQEMKHAIVTPLIKKSSLDPEILKNYRPVSNLSFLSKIIEKAASKQLCEHISRNDLSEKMQSAYKKQHSTETALLSVQNDLLMAIDNKQGAILILLDLSAAFDTIDHDLLFKRMDIKFGIRGNALNWFRSYLTGRTQSVKIKDCFSSRSHVKFGVPQGSVLGPALFSLYSAPVADIARKHGLKVHLYADDTQLYITFDVSDILNAVARVEACVAEIKAWMVTNRLMLNGDKTIFLLLGSPRQSLSCDIDHVTIDGHKITRSITAKNLGVIFDERINMDAQIKEVCRVSMFHLRNIARIGHCLPVKVAEQLIHAFVSSKLDYCNSLLYGLPSTSLSRLQRVQNIAARILTKTKKYDHISPVLRRLHWLPVEKRIVYKLMLFTFYVINDMAPQYIRDLITPHIPTRSLRSEETCRLVVPMTRLRGFGDRSFAKAAPSIWNSLPKDLRQCSSLSILRSRLKKCIVTE